MIMGPKQKKKQHTSIKRTAETFSSDGKESKRTIQNRLAQRAYRARKLGRIKELEAKVAELTALIERDEGADVGESQAVCDDCETNALRERFMELQVEYEALSIMAQQQECFALAAAAASAEPNLFPQSSYQEIQFPVAAEPQFHQYRNCGHDDENDDNGEHLWEDLNFDASSVDLDIVVPPPMTTNYLETELKAIPSLNEASDLIDRLCGLMISQPRGAEEAVEIVRNGLRVKYDILRACTSEHDKIKILHVFETARKENSEAVKDVLEKAVPSGRPTLSLSEQHQTSSLKISDAFLDELKKIPGLESDEAENLMNQICACYKEKENCSPDLRDGYTVEILTLKFMLLDLVVVDDGDEDGDAKTKAIELVHWFGEEEFQKK